MTSVGRLNQILELEQLVTELLETARKLPSASQRDDILKEIETFRARVTALRQSETPLSSS